MQLGLPPSTPAQENNERRINHINFIRKKKQSKTSFGDDTEVVSSYK